MPDETQSTASAAPAAEQFSEAPATPENDEQKNAKVKDGVQKRIDELTYRANQAQREKQIAEDYAKAVEANLLQQKRELAQYQAYATAPRVDQFNSVEGGRQRLCAMQPIRRIIRFSQRCNNSG